MAAAKAGKGKGNDDNMDNISLRNLSVKSGASSQKVDFTGLFKNKRSDTGAAGIGGIGGLK